MCSVSARFYDCQLLQAQFGLGGLHNLVDTIVAPLIFCKPPLTFFFSPLVRSLTVSLLTFNLLTLTLALPLPTIIVTSSFVLLRAATTGALRDNKSPGCSVQSRKCSGDIDSDGFPGTIPAQRKMFSRGRFVLPITGRHSQLNAGSGPTISLSREAVYHIPLLISGDISHWIL